MTRQMGGGVAWGDLGGVWEFLADLASYEGWEHFDNDALVSRAWHQLGLSVLAMTPEANVAALQGLDRAHRMLRPLLLDLFSGKRVNVDVTASLRDQVWLEASPDTALAAAVSSGDPIIASEAYNDPPQQLSAMLHVGIMGMLRARPFPLGRCIHCGRFFFRGTDFRRKQCSRSCTLKAADKRRRTREREDEAMMRGMAAQLFADSESEAATKGARTDQTSSAKGRKRKPGKGRANRGK